MSKFKVPGHVKSVNFGGEGCGEEHFPDKDGVIDCAECAAAASAVTLHAPADHGQATPQAAEAPSVVAEVVKGAEDFEARVAAEVAKQVKAALAKADKPRSDPLAAARAAKAAKKAAAAAAQTESN